MSQQSHNEDEAVDWVSRIVRIVMLLAFVVGMTAMMGRTLVLVFDATRAVPPEEFPAAGVVKAWSAEFRLTQWICGTLFASATMYEVWRVLSEARGSGLVDKLKRHGATVAAWLISGAAMFGTLLEPELALVGAVALYAAFVSEAATDILERGPVANANRLELIDAVASITPASVGRGSAEIFLLPGIAFLLGVWGELAFYTHDFAGDFFPVGDFWRFSLLASSGALVTGARLGLELLLLLLLMRLMVTPPDGKRWQDLTAVAVVSAVAMSLYTSFSWQWYEVASATAFMLILRVAWGWQTDARRVLLLALLPGLYVWARTRDILLSAMQDEIAALDFIWMSYLLFGLLGLLVAVWGQLSLFAWARQHGVKGPGEALTVVLMSVLCPIFPAFVDKRRSAESSLRLGGLAALVFLAAVLSLLLALNYPAFTDYFQFMQKLFSMLIGYVVFGALLVAYLHVAQKRVLRLHRGLAWSVAVLLAAVIGHSVLDGSQMLRFIGHQYSKVSRRAVEMGRLVPEPARIGLRDQDKPSAAPPELATMERYPELPDEATGFYEERRPFILVIVWDAARHDHMSAYGYHRDTTPAAAALAEESVVFTRARSSASATSASLRHFFSGRLSSRYMLEQNHHPFLTGDLYDVGYDWFLLNILGSDYNGVSRQAFLRHQGDRKLDPLTLEFSTYEEQRKNDTFFDMLDIALADRREREHPSDGMFVFLHCATTHYPWQLWDDHENYGDSFVDLYDNSMGHVDKAFGDLIAGLKERGIYDDAIIVLTADHGTGLNEHGIYGGFQPWEEQIRVPLIIKAPGFEPGATDVQASGIDIVPTLINLFNPGGENRFDGFSLVEAMAGEAESLQRRYLFSQSAFEDALAVIDLETGYKIHVHRTERYEQLYNLHEDPGELENLADREPEVVNGFLKWLRPMLWHRRTKFGNPYHYRALELEE